MKVTTQLPIMQEAPRKTNLLQCVDGLRGLAIILVILFHLHHHRQRGYHPEVARILRSCSQGYTGVHLFFVLSGFCLTYSLLRKEATGKPARLAEYLQARFWRIAPPYYASILFYLA